MGFKKKQRRELEMYCGWIVSGEVRVGLEAVEGGRGGLEGARLGRKS